jgi:hypothetical protein
LEQSVARLWQFLPALLIVIGALVAASGGFWQSWRQSKFNAEIGQKNEKIIALQDKNMSAIMGGDSYCNLALLSALKPTDQAANGVLILHGENPLYDVTVRVVDLNEYEQRLIAGDPTASDVLFGTTIGVGNMIPNAVRPVTFPRSTGNEVSYNIFFFARNGAWVQQLRMQSTGTKWARASRVYALDQKYNQGEQRLLEVDPDYPLDAKGEVEWERKPASKPMAR